MHAGRRGERCLGAPVEFDSLKEIRRRFGADGLRDYVPAYGRRGAITDDTQMALFTAEGLIRAAVRYDERGKGSRSAGLPWRAVDLDPCGEHRLIDVSRRGGANHTHFVRLFRV